MADKTIRTRFAPSPTGPLHIGGMRTALYAFLFARRHGGEFLLRIEDTDRNRFVEGAEAYIVESLQWCGIGFDGPVVRQSDHAGKYGQYAEQLVKNGHAYYAFDSNEELEKARRLAMERQETFSYNAATRMGMNNSLTVSEEITGKRISSNMPYVIRLQTEPDHQVAFTDLVRGEVTVASKLIDDKVLLKSDGMPTYHLAHIVDDYLAGITHVIRGEEWLPSAPAHILIYKYLGWNDHLPQYAHLPLILKPDGRGKLSKRDGSRLGFPVFPIQWHDAASGIFPGYREAGYYPEAFVNMLALIGWNPGTEQEIFTMDELIGAFSFDHVHKAAARFDPDKAKWFNMQWLQKKPDAEIAARLREELKQQIPSAAGLPDVFLVRCVQLLKPRIHFENEIIPAGRYLFEPPAAYDRQTLERKWKPGFENFFIELGRALESTGPFDVPNIEQSFSETAKKNGLKPGAVLQLLRLLVSGQAAGVDLFPMMELLGREEVCSRIGKGVGAVRAEIEKTNE